MCGRFVSTSPTAVLADFFGVADVRTEALDESFNVAPTDPVYAVAERDGERLLGSYRWGLVPHWAKDVKVGARMINARSETLASKFRPAFERRRCLVPADGFYEWEKVEGSKTKQPWFIRRADGAPLAFAALWETWRDPAGPDDAALLRTCTIVTTDANDLVRRIHDRMPVLLPAWRWDAWLDRENRDIDALRAMLVPADPREMEMHPVSTRVSSVRNNDGDLITPLNSK